MNIAISLRSQQNNCDVAIIGAGPYGLAVAAHLRAADIQVRIFGEPVSFWRRNMPAGMKLRSPWIATHIAEPEGRYTLDDYYREIGLPIPKLLPLEYFTFYGRWFQQKVAPQLDTRAVLSVSKVENGFHIALEDGERFFARRVVMATGLLNHEYRPAQFNGLPRSLVSHSCEHTDSERYRGKRVAVIGRGQSACESAAILHEAGADVEIICRGHLEWNADPDERGSLRKTVRAVLGNILIPPSQVGPFPFNWANEAPALLHYLSQDRRDRWNEHNLRATAILWLRPRLQDVPFNQGRRILEARRDGNRVALKLDNGTRHFDHVLLATGYRIDVDKMNVLEPTLRRQVARHHGLPVLKGGLESSVEGLHFVGASAVGSFGPLLRFIAGAGFAARRVAGAVVDSKQTAGIFAEEDLESFAQTPFPLTAERERS